MKADEKTVTAPEKYAVEQIAVDLIDPSPANKRRFSDDDKSLRELGDSIEAQGLLQAIVVRQSPVKKTRYELVAGERRWRAFRLKGWKNIPAVVRTLTDSEAHDITASENLQREDLSPIEEAESIQVLIADGRDTKEIADRLGKPVSWVARRARIAELSPKWMKAISDPRHPLSKWSATHLELIARYDVKRQEELFDKRYGSKYDSNNTLVTVKDLERSLNEQEHRLSIAPWKIDDETLLPSAGACTLCQKRTSCAPDLFEAIEDTKIGRGDRCIDQECWGRKLVAHHKIRIKKVREEHQNLILISKDDNTLPKGHPWEKAVVDHWKYDTAKKGDKGAVPAYIVDGPGAGRIEYRVMRECYSNRSDRPVDEDGKPLPKTLEERRAGLEKRRIIRFINKLMLMLDGEDPDSTGAKPGVCRVCGCTEDDCSGCMEKTGEPCHWTDSSKTLCSACAGADAEKTDRREPIVENLSHIEVHALVAAFGAVEADYRKLGLEMGNLECWEKYGNVIQMNGGDAIRVVAYCAFDRIINQLRQITNSSEPCIGFPNKLCTALKLDREAIWKKVLEEIPEPKAWAKLEENKIEPKGAQKKKRSKRLSDLLPESDGETEATMTVESGDRCEA